MMSRARNILVVAKQAPYEQYLQLKAQGKAPPALKWDRLRSRYEAHKLCLDRVIKVLELQSVNFAVIGREDMHRSILTDKDLVVSVGGDGTLLATASFMDDSVPIVGVNSDPADPAVGTGQLKTSADERRSKGAICAATAWNIEDVLPPIIRGDEPPGSRTRIQTLVRSTYTETRLPPALNDLLISHPIPAAVSRFRLSLCKGQIAPSFKNAVQTDERWSLSVWSSGLWVSSATGSSAAMHAAGGSIMEPHSPLLQYRVREQLVEEEGRQSELGQGFIGTDEMLCMRWNNQFGCIYIDGSHLKHDLQLGDEVYVDGHAPPLRLYEPRTV